MEDTSFGTRCMTDWVIFMGHCECEIASIERAEREWS